jgi:hypothetical protein
VLIYASTGRGHERGRLMADALRGVLPEPPLKRRCLQNRDRDALLALALLPVTGPRELLSRYRTLRRFLESGSGGSARRQALERQAVSVAMGNLAAAAGYDDADRLIWALELRQNARLRPEHLSLTLRGVRVRLLIDDRWKVRLVHQAQPESKPTQTEAAEPTASASRRASRMPNWLRRAPEVQRLKRLAHRLRLQIERLRRRLESAMYDGGHLRPDELQRLLAHPVLEGMLRRVVFIGQGSFGYPTDGGRGLRDCHGHVEPLLPHERLRPAHPWDFFHQGGWEHWQRQCFQNRWVQPFKQVFRELYTLTDAERAGFVVSRRYAGQLVHPSQATALLYRCGWTISPSGGARRSFPVQQLEAHLSFTSPMRTPAEVEGLTLDQVSFHPVQQSQAIPLERVPPGVFSETMRDLDLVVSVAHAGGGPGPGATASTLQMRARLVEETVQVLKHRNVRVDGEQHRAIIAGTLGEYTVHLGSGVAHRIPGGALVLVAVRHPQRGRLFLPFADEDPLTAEVLSKVLLLARDDRIRDPALLAQIQGTP